MADEERPEEERDGARPRRVQPSRRERRRAERQARRAAAAPGRRVAASRARRRRARLRTTGVVTLLGLAAVAVLLVVSGLGERARDLVAGDPLPDVPDVLPDERQPTLTLVTTVDDGEGERAAALTVLSIDRDTGEGTVLLVPTRTVADVPGFGTFPLAEAQGFGGAGLVGVSLDNLLQVQVPHVGSLDLDGWATVVDAAGGVPATFTSPVTLTTDDGELRVPEGPRTVDGALAAALLGARGPGESELDVVARGARVVVGLLDAAADPDRFDAAVAALDEVVDGVPSDVVATVLAEMAAARAEGQVTALTLPVSPLGTGGDEAYRPDGPRIATLVAERLAGAVPDASVADGRRLQLLNGNGRPGVGASVARVLQPAGYRVVLTGNADRFTYEVTRIIVHDDAPATLAAARDVRDRLGVGEIERAGIPQTVVDLTIIVGRDFEPGEPLPGDPVDGVDVDELDDLEDGDADGGDDAG